MPLTPKLRSVWWRRRRDSNPRGPFGPNGFQDRRFQPLTHSSDSKYIVLWLLAGCLVTVLTSISDTLSTRVSPKPSRSRSGDEVGLHSSVKTVDTKILAVHGEDFSDAFTFGNPNERCIGKVHRTVGVLAHQFAHSRNICEIER
jgi:hypothetical protein